MQRKLLQFDEWILIFFLLKRSFFYKLFILFSPTASLTSKCWCDLLHQHRVQISSQCVHFLITFLKICLLLLAGHYWRAHFHFALFINLEAYSDCMVVCVQMPMATDRCLAGYCRKRRLDGPKCLHAHPRSHLLEILRLHSSVHSSPSQTVCILPSGDFEQRLVALLAVTTWKDMLLAPSIIVKDEGCC